MNFPLLLFGFYQVKAEKAYATSVLNLCLQECLTLTGFQTDSAGNLSFLVGSLSGARLRSKCRQSGIPATFVRGGFPKYFFLLPKRMGLIFGLFAGIFLLLFSGRFVWSVRVSGNADLTAGEIRQTLAEQGLEVGSYLPRLNLSEIETKTLIAQDRLSWIAVHLNGTVAEVQVMENHSLPAKNNHPANLVAAADGQIEELELYRGKAVVEVGQPVQKGDLLVSGIYDSQTLGYRYTRAAGKVLARTERNLCVQVPLYETRKTYQSSSSDFKFQFFKFSFYFFKNSRNDDGNCDIIEVTTGKDWLGLHDLPVSVVKTTYRPYVEERISRSPEKALEIAYVNLNKQLSDLSPDIRLLEKKIQTQIGEEMLTLECRLSCVEDIAVQQEFEISEP